MKRHIIGLLPLVLLIASSAPASAQRTMDRQMFIGASGSWTGSGAGAAVSFGQYLLSSEWDVAVCANQYTSPLSSGDRLYHPQVLASGAWKYRVAGTRSRLCSVYAGGGVFLGYEMHDPLSSLPSTVETGFGKGVFIYGVHAGADVEIFLCRRVAVVLSGVIPINFSSPVRYFHWGAGGGIRFNL